MPINPYALCPGGTGKKIKFCCPDLQADLEKIQRMLEGEQYQASLSLIERLDAKQPGRACMMGLKSLLLRISGRLEEAKATAAAFLAKFPNNPIALSESAILAALGEGGKAAMPLLVRSFAACDGAILPRVYQTIRAVAEVLLMEENYVPAQAVIGVLAQIRTDDRRTFDLAAHIARSRRIPIWVKDEGRFHPCPADVPWKAEFEKAFLPCATIQWHLAAENLSMLAGKLGDPPVIWRNIATLRAWMADTPAAAKILERYATMDVPLEDAVEAQAMAFYYADDPLGDQFDVMAVEYEVKDVEPLQVALGSSPRILAMQGDLASFAEADDGPPPKAAWFLFDRSAPADGAEPALDNIASAMATLVLFGRQTDRPARLVLHSVAARDVEPAQVLLAGLAGSALGQPTLVKAEDRVSATVDLLAARWRVPEGLTRPQYQRLLAEHADEAILKRWPELLLGIFQGQSARQAAAQPALRVKVLSAIMLLEFYAREHDVRFDFNRLRDELGLPRLERIDPQQLPLEQLPAARLARVTVEKLSDEALVQGYRRVSALDERDAMLSFGRELVDRPGLAKRPERMEALVALANFEEDLDRSLRWADQGRQAAETAGQSSAFWDLLELSLRIRRQEENEAVRLIHHIESQHGREPGILDSLRDMLMRFGILGPDGGAPAGAAAPLDEGPGIVLPDATGAKPGELWTPDSQKPAGAKSALWVPGSE